ncbi:hypothetical protein CASFOL_035360 [Castilleja foliolosa]|uniref:GATA-type domain-containing protein n=1 Tax=Castilleja foliolosa TaxID=1961234 RepID=A0ABD3BT99_9LAMI
MENYNKGLPVVDTELRLGPALSPVENQDARNTTQLLHNVSSSMMIGMNEVGQLANTLIYPNRRRHVERVCTACRTNTTPLWRKGPNGPQTLCNACGLKHLRALKRGAE